MNLGMIQKQGNWMPQKWKLRDVKGCWFPCEQIIERQRWKEINVFEWRIERQTIGTHKT